MSNEKFVPHKNVPGAVRLKLERANNSGTVNSDPMFMADRQAIINHVMAYSYLIDEGRWDDWFALFSDDAAHQSWAQSSPAALTPPSLGRSAAGPTTHLRPIGQPVEIWISCARILPPPVRAGSDLF